MLRNYVEAATSDRRFSLFLLAHSLDKILHAPFNPFFPIYVAEVLGRPQAFAAAFRGAETLAQTCASFGFGFLSTNARAKAALRAKEEREKRVSHLMQVAARRVGQMALSRGWSGWHDAWSSQRRRMRMLQAAGARLQRPLLSASLSHWRQDWAASVREAIERGHQRVLRVTVPR